MTQTKTEKRVIKLVVVGDGAVGKTCALMCFARNEFPKEYVPTVFDNQITHITLNEERILISLWDTSGQDDYERLRPLSYPGTDIFLLCYSVARRDSFKNIKTKWYLEIKHHCPNVPFVLVGCKTDLRKDEKYLKEKNVVPVRYEEGLSLANEINAVSFQEMSSLTRENLKGTFTESIKCVLEERKPLGKKKKVCMIL
ncbi:gtpase crac1b [Anaeramoeba flamelloides]|uniref:Gtpase crac1b n=1 Tax=Anaeramoeba flamelloides TaxID=1746091 RepID=A0AAV7ZFT9_9EUKA|nr:gtpase crac1b [Anaeramoeba flamelloides]